MKARLAVLFAAFLSGCAATVPAELPDTGTAASLDATTGWIDAASGGVAPDAASPAQDGDASFSGADAAVAPHCTNHVKDGNESDVDCGGDCPSRCGDGLACRTPDDCDSNLCPGKVCAPCLPDGVKDGRESDVDCGAKCPTQCKDGKSCGVDADCETGGCRGGTCVSCTDKIQNGNETDMDCGGDCPARCADGSACLVNGDCTSGHCFAKKCFDCTNGAADGDESDVDCGGSCPNRCAENRTCRADPDCASQLCRTGNCHNCLVDGTKNGLEADVDCGAACTILCPAGSSCASDPDCSAGTVCEAGTCVAFAAPPKVMLVVDKSGSMKSVAASETWGCCASASGATCDGYSATGDCKWNTLKSLLLDTGGLLDSTKTTVRYGLSLFPGASVTPTDACAVTGPVVPVANQAGAANVADLQTALDSAVPSGGTPISATLRTVAADALFTSVERATRRHVVLVTDGLPNCNANIATCSACTNTGGNPASNCGNKQNCLDDKDLVAAIAALKTLGIDTFVVGFGSATSDTSVSAVLDAAADAGGQARVGEATKYYKAPDAAGLQIALDLIKSKL